MADLKLLSINCRGLAQQHKRRDVLNYLNKSSADIIFLQETHLTQHTIQYFNTLCLGKCYHSYKTSNSRGTTIILRPSLSFDIISEHSSNDGNLVMVVIKVNNNILTLMNVYGPNDDTPSFYNNMDSLLQQVPQENVIIGGDFNFVIDRSKDSNYEHDNNICAKNVFRDIAKKYSLIDTWRRLHPHDREYTWMKPNPLKYGRIDMFFASEHLLSHIREANIKAGYRTDHCQISLALQAFNEQRGPGLWKFNESLLEDENYSNIIKACIVDVVQQYSVPVYSRVFISNPSNFEEVQLTINISLFYETLLMLIRGQTVKYSKQKARRLREREETANKEIDRFRNAFARTGANSDMNNLLSAQDNLQKLREPKIQGAIARSRVKWYEEGEKCSKYFLSLEKRNGVRKSIQSLSINNNTITRKDEILSQFTNHLNRKYNVFEEPLNANEYIKRNITKKISHKQKCKLDEPLTLAELSAALSSMKKGRSPGSNGFTADFFKHFWNYLGIFLFRSVNESITNGSLPLSHRESIITLIPKAGKPLNSLKDWRPISLLNVDFKIISSAITNRLKTVIQDVISPSQSAYIKGRFIGENSRLVYDVIEELNQQNRSGLILAADFEAAFESVSWGFLSQAMHCYNFGPHYRYLISLLYLNNNNFARVLLDGFLGEKIYMKRGIRQGDPVSGYLFNLVVEPLANQIMQSTIIRGISVSSECEIRLSQYADDLIVFLDNRTEYVTGAIKEIQTFTLMSGLKMNIDKTKCLPIGKRINSMPPNLEGIEYVEELKILGLTFSRNNDNVTKVNIMKKLPSIEKEILQWKRRHLTMIGKITIIKALLLSKLVHIFTALPNPSNNLIAKINTIFYKFIWNGKNDRVKRTKMIQRQEYDGLNMVHVEGFIKSMKISWIERLYQSDHSWLNIAERNIPFLEDLRTYGSSKLRSLRNSIPNPFWKDALEAWINLFELYQPNSDQIITEKLWFTDISKFSSSIINSWDDKGIRYVADLINNKTGTFYSKSEIENIYNIKMTFLCYASLIRSLPNIVKKTNYTGKILYPLIPYKVGLMNGSIKMSRLAYKEFQESVRSKHKKSQERIEYKWNRDIQCFQFGTMYDISLVTKNTYLQAFHFRLISRIVPTKRFLHIVGISENNLCSFCSTSIETLPHLFWDCESTQRFISDIKRKLSSMFNTNYTVSKKTWFFPNVKECTELEILVTTIGKVTIYKAQAKQISLSINHFFNNLRLEAEKEMHLARSKDSVEQFNAKWGPLQCITRANT